MGNGPIRSSQRTKQAILDAARSGFASSGFERTTMRGIAKEAGCDPAMVVRYFNTKRELFQAAIDLPLDHLPATASDSPVALAQLITSFLETWDRDQTFAGLLRASATDEDAVATMREFFERRVLARLSLWTGGSEQRATLMGAMLLGIAWARFVARFDRIANASPTELAAEILAIVSEERLAASPTDGSPEYSPGLEGDH